MTDNSFDLKQFKDDLAKQAFGMTPGEAFAAGLCISCKRPAAEHIHSLEGEKEYKLSAMCEECFDNAMSNLADEVFKNEDGN